MHHGRDNSCQINRLVASSIDFCHSFSTPSSGHAALGGFKAQTLPVENRNAGPVQENKGRARSRGRDGMGRDLGN